MPVVLEGKQGHRGVERPGLAEMQLATGLPPEGQLAVRPERQGRMAPGNLYVHTVQVAGTPDNTLSLAEVMYHRNDNS